MAGENVPVRMLQGGSVLEVASGGSISINAGGSIQNAGALSLGGSVTVSGSLSVTGVAAAPALTLGGTAAKWSFGTFGLASGVGTVATGMGTVLGFAANAIGANIGAGTFTSVQVDMSLQNSGSVICRALSGSLAFTAAGTISWVAFGIN